MKVTLHTQSRGLAGNIRAVTEAAGDVTLDVPGKTELEAGETIDGFISEGNSGHEEKAYLKASYPAVEFPGGSPDLSAIVVAPTEHVPGFFPIKTAVKFTVQ
jgi:hypothetical protein